MPGYNATSSAENKRTIQAFKFLNFYTSSFGFAICLHYFIAPLTPIYITSEIHPKFMNSYILFFNCIFVVWIVGAITLTFTMGLYFLILYCNLFVPIYKNEFMLGHQPPGLQKSSQLLRTFAHFPHMYRSLNILITMKNDVLGKTILPAQVIFWQLAIFLYLALNRYWDKLHVVARLFLVNLATGFVVCWCLTLKMFGQMLVWNVKTRLSWKRADANCDLIRGNLFGYKYVKRFRLSCRPLYMGYKTYFIIKPLSVLVFLRRVAWGASKAVLMTRGIQG